MTVLQLLNKVLRGLRQEALEAATSVISDAYELLILQLLNEAKEEIEEAWDWFALRQTVTVTLADGQSDYTLSAAEDADVDVSDRARLLYAKAVPLSMGTNYETSSRASGNLPQVYDVTDSTEHRLQEIPLEWIERQHLLDNDEEQEPQYFAMYASGGFVKMKVWPTPSEARTLKIRFVIPQAELEADELDTALTIPSRPVWTLALFKANEERGSELGRPGSSLYMAHVDALYAAKAREQTDSDLTSFVK